jgi:hypothetical protein
MVTIDSAVRVPARITEALAALDPDGSLTIELEADGPAGELHAALCCDQKVWAATDTHALRVDYFTDRPAAWDALLGDIAVGLTDCTDDRCEWNE